MNILPGNLRFGAGQPVKRLEDQRLLTGKGQFIDDKPAEGTLWLHVLRSPHAHAKIVSIDTKAALDMPGASAVWPEAPDNVVAAMSYGDAAKVEAAFAGAAHTVSLDLVSQRLVPSAIEPRSTIAEVDKKSGRL